MRMVGGLEEPTSGRILLRGERLTTPDRRRGMVFQSYSAFPWLTVEGNVAYGMRYRSDLSAAEKKSRAAHFLALVGLTDFRDSWPNRISGGMRQRREFLQVELRRIQLEERKTVVFVTHDVEEAAFLADRVIVFTRRPARILAEVDVTARLGSGRTLELRESPEFFALRNELLHLVRSTASEEE
jgi:NitT/TauT family transport system ATP-binding protein